MRQTMMTSTYAAYATLMREVSLADTHYAHTGAHPHFLILSNTIGIGCNRQFEWEAASSALLAPLLTRATVNTDSTEGREEAAYGLLRKQV